MDYPGFVGPSRPSVSPTVSIERLVNWYVAREGPILLPTPGLTAFGAGTTVGVRGALQVGTRTFAVIGTDVGELSTAGTWTSRGTVDRKSTRLNSSHIQKSRMPSSA